MALSLSIFTVVALFMWQGHRGLNLWDEGYLWYGAQRVMLGEVPIRDFMSYDPGRYYWSAALMTAGGDDGIMALRRAVAIFQAAGLFVGLLLAGWNPKNRSFTWLLLSAVTLAVWMFPRHKLFDISLSVLLTGVLAFLISNPTRLRFFFAGACIGFVAVFGRNHGVYGLAGGLGVVGWLALKPAPAGDGGFFRAAGYFAAGVAAGFSPVLLMALMLPGFAGAFWETIVFMFQQKATNLALPVPWPWKAALGSTGVGEVVREVLIGLFFIAVVVFGLVSIAWVVRQRRNGSRVSPVIAATAFLALPYAHYAYSRADAGHLAQGVFPLLIGSLTVLGTRPFKIKWPGIILLCGTSLWVTHIHHPGWQCGGSNTCTGIEVSGTILEVPSDTAASVDLLRTLAREYAPDGRSLVVTPFWPGAYSLLERQSPMWGIYALQPRSESAQLDEIERIRAANPGLIFVYDLPLDGREELRFRHTHPLIHRYIVDHFERLDITSNPAYQIYTPFPSGCKT